MSASSWEITWADGHVESLWGTIRVLEGCYVEIVSYSGGVGGFPRPLDTRVVAASQVASWRSRGSF